LKSFFFHLVEKFIQTHNLKKRAQANLQTEEALTKEWVDHLHEAEGHIRKGNIAKAVRSLKEVIATDQDLFKLARHTRKDVAAIRDFIENELAVLAK
jgi:hypothetical protein